MNEPVKGVLAIIAATIIWGLAPLYYKLLEHIPPFELLSHRTFWSFVFSLWFYISAVGLESCGQQYLISLRRFSYYWLLFLWLLTGSFLFSQSKQIKQ